MHNIKHDGLYAYIKLITILIKKICKHKNINNDTNFIY
jgi:hypothetical protein